MGSLHDAGGPGWALTVLTLLSLSGQRLWSLPTNMVLLEQQLGQLFPQMTTPQGQSQSLPASSEAASPFSPYLPGFGKIGG